MRQIFDDFTIKHTVNNKAIIHINDSLYKEVKSFLQRNFESSSKQRFYQCVEWLRSWCREINDIAGLDNYSTLEKYRNQNKIQYIWECNDIGFFIILVIVLNNQTHILVDALLNRNPNESSILNKKSKSKFNLLENFTLKSKSEKKRLYESIMRDVAKIVKRHLEYIKLDN